MVGFLKRLAQRNKQSADSCSQFQGSTEAGLKVEYSGRGFANSPVEALPRKIDRCE